MRHNTHERYSITEQKSSNEAKIHAGQAQHDLVIALKDRIALGEGDPCVLVYADCRMGDFSVERWQVGETGWGTMDGDRRAGVCVA
jgi:hypothetical protein